ncbi:glycosyltransferase [Aquicoccus sp. SCR17]|nr:glycosyltransferase [Carideicomes alvinocaridis]
MADPTVLTILLNYRTAEMTLRAAEAAVTAMEGVAGQITIVDNDSRDGSWEKIVDEVEARGWDRVHPLRSPVNGGFGAGNNLAIRARLADGARPDYVYLLNSDAFPAPDAIRKLRDHLQLQRHVGIAGSHIHGEDGVPHVTAFRFPSIAGEFEQAARTGPITRLLEGRKIPMAIPTLTRRVDWLAGASMMIRQSVLDRIGLFDEGYFLYFEETDLCLRAARAGYITHYVVDSRVAHIGSGSTGMKTWDSVPAYWYESRLRYFSKNHGAAYAAAVDAARLAGGGLWHLRRLLTGRAPDGPRHFLRRLAAHDLRAALTALGAMATGRSARTGSARKGDL